MALVIPSSRGIKRERNYASPPTATWGTGMTASATPHALSATRTEIIAATAFEAEWIRITCQETTVSASLTDSLLNIYIGGAGSEVLFIDSLQAGWSATIVSAVSPRSYWFPVRIPRGTRISGTLRALIASDTIEVLVELGTSNGEHWVGSGVETLGETTASSRGTAVTPGNAVEGSYASIGTSGYRYRYIVPGIQGNNDTTLLGEPVAWDIGVGSASYQGLDDWMSQDNAGEVQVPWHGSQGFWCDIPSGTALQMRAAARAAVSGLQYACLYGVY